MLHFDGNDVYNSNELSGIVCVFMCTCKVYYYIPAYNFIRVYNNVKN
jgi:hypothetical protein